MKIYKCPKCKKYTMENICSICKTKTVNSKPAKFSPEDPYGKYRRMMKKESEIKSYRTK